MVKRHIPPRLKATDTAVDTKTVKRTVMGMTVVPKKDVPEPLLVMFQQYIEQHRVDPTICLFVADAESRGGVSMLIFDPHL